MDHILIIAGDILDRGTMGNDLIRYLEKLIEKKRLLGVLGNHDLFLIDIMNDNYRLEKVLFNISKNGFIETLQLGFKRDIRNFEVTKELIEEFKKNFSMKYPIFVKWILELPLYLEFNHHVIVHGFLDFSLRDWKYTSQRFAIWDRGYAKEIPCSFHKKLVFGHTPNYHINKQDNIIYEGLKIMIDGGAASRHQVNILYLTEREI
ncbi:MAG: metallophosphoesterase [Tenericutes bacterium]|nr:metallophosphoesterase [Mycoplasmatota bacterium]